MCAVWTRARRTRTQEEISSDTRTHPTSPTRERACGPHPRSQPSSAGRSVQERTNVVNGGVFLSVVKPQGASASVALTSCYYATTHLRAPVAYARRYAPQRYMLGVSVVDAVVEHVDMGRRTQPQWERTDGGEGIASSCVSFGSRLWSLTTLLSTRDTRGWEFSQPQVQRDHGHATSRRHAPGLTLVCVPNTNSYDTHPKPPEKPAEEAPPPAKGAKAAPPPMELEEPAEPPSRVRQGPGVYSDGAIYFKGEFEVDGVDRQGLLKCASGASYEGGFDKGIYHGQGKYTWPDGSRYEGGWRQGVMHGTGTYHCTQRDETFHGQYYNGAGPGFFGQR